jgi:hypothetical protein
MIEGSFKVAILKLPLADLILEVRRVELMSKRIRGVLALEKSEGRRQGFKNGANGMSDIDGDAARVAGASAGARVTN